jgi:ABC-type dipeptide/oligopeptide/nickel transport system permease subunit
MEASASSQITWRTAKPRSLWGDAARTFARSKAGMIGLFMAIVLLFSAIFAPLIAPYDHLEQDWDNLRQPPSRRHIFGTDELGRDVFSRILMGLRTAFLVAAIMTALSTAVGVLTSSICTLIGGWVDTALVWLMDALMNFPGIWLAAFITVATRPTVSRWAEAAFERTGMEVFKDTVVIDYVLVFSCLALVSWPGIGRLVRGQVLSLREKEFIEAQRAIGSSAWRITLNHLIPNVFGPVMVAISAGFGGAMLAESSLSFLGIGIRPPGASLGNMIASSISLWRSEPHLVVMPGLVLSICVLSFNLIGDALNDALNPRARGR